MPHSAPRLNTTTDIGSGPPVFPSCPIPCPLNPPILPVISAIYVHPVTDGKIAGKRGITPSFSRLRPSKTAYYGRMTFPPREFFRRRILAGSSSPPGLMTRLIPENDPSREGEGWGIPYPFSRQRTLQGGGTSFHRHTTGNDLLIRQE